jgi:hypothetical protein
MTARSARLSPSNAALALLTGKCTFENFEREYRIPDGSDHATVQRYRAFFTSVASILADAGSDELARDVRALVPERSSAARGKSAPVIGETREITVQQSKNTDGEPLGDPWARINVGPYFGASDKGKALVVTYNKNNITISW